MEYILLIFAVLAVLFAFLWRRDDSRARRENERLADELKNEREKRSEAEKHIAAGDVMKAQFQRIAQEIIEERGKKFAEKSGEDLENLLKPLNAKLQEFAESAKTEGRDREALRELLRGHVDRLSTDAENLTRALLGDSKVMGDWGEMTLERLLEATELKPGVHYEMQASLKNEDGKTLIPDCKINLQDGRHLLVDSKVSLAAYSRYVAAEDDDVRKAELSEHVRSVRKHIHDLADKHYSSAKGINAPDFVFMFMPIEPAWIAAMTSDKFLFMGAYKKKIVPVTHTTMMPTLQVVAQIWKFERQSQNARDIAKSAGAIYDKVNAFLKHFDELGRGINRASKAYHDARSNLTEGQGNLVRKIEDLRELGADVRQPMPEEIRREAGIGEEDSEKGSKL